MTRLLTACVHRGPWVVVGAPQDRGGCVNEDLACATCGALVGVRSWTAEAWQRRKETR